MWRKARCWGAPPCGKELGGHCWCWRRVVCGRWQGVADWQDLWHRHQWASGDTSDDAQRSPWSRTSLGSQDRVAIVHYDNKDSGGQGTLMLIHLIKLAGASSVFLLFTLEKVDSSNTDDIWNIWEEIIWLSFWLQSIWPSSVFLLFTLEIQMVNSSNTDDEAMEEDERTHGQLNL